MIPYIYAGSETVLSARNNPASRMLQWSHKIAEKYGRVCDHACGKHIEVENVFFLLSGISQSGHARTSRGERWRDEGRYIVHKPKRNRTVGTSPNWSRYKNAYRMKRCRQVQAKFVDATIGLRFELWNFIFEEAESKKLNLCVCLKEAYSIRQRERRCLYLKISEDSNFKVPITKVNITSL